MSTPESRRSDSAKTSTEAPVAVGLASGALVAAAATRTCLIIGPPAAHNVTVSSLATAVLSQGLVIRPTDPPLVIDIERYGNLVTGAWTAITVTGADSVNVFDVRSTAG